MFKTQQQASSENQVIDEELVEILAGLSVWADYPEEDIPQVDENMLKNNIKKICKKLHAMIDNYDTFKCIKEGIKTAIVGRPNVGKSTLMNCLSDSQKSIVTDIPGTTRDAIEETVMISDIPVLLVDTAGIRDTLDKVEKIGVEKARKYIDESEITLFMIDASSALCDEDRELLDKLDKSKTIIILNKCDIGVKVDARELSTFKNRIVELSALKGQGIEKLKEIFENIVGLSNFDPSDTVVCNERQLLALKKAVEILEEIINQLDFGITLDAVTVLIQDTLSVFMELTGENVSEAIVNKVFSKFCVGK